MGALMYCCLGVFVCRNCICCVIDSGKINVKPTDTHWSTDRYIGEENLLFHYPSGSKPKNKNRTKTKRKNEHKKETSLTIT